MINYLQSVWESKNGKVDNGPHCRNECEKSENFSGLFVQDVNTLGQYSRLNPVKLPGRSAGANESVSINSHQEGVAAGPRGLNARFVLARESG